MWKILEQTVGLLIGYRRLLLRIELPHDMNVRIFLSHDVTKAVHALLMAGNIHRTGNDCHLTAAANAFGQQRSRQPSALNTVLPDKAQAVRTGHI